jgi:antitoxin component YwqK of YwqJK toxin-antitoxin module
MSNARSPLYPNGLPRFKGEFLDGLMHGYWEFYRVDGSVMRTGTFDREVQVGVWKTFARDGSLVKETNFGGEVLES